ncbi:MAG TPA: hypothetical protein VMU17_02285 [Elusimicrobiota bacterium]|nr:hypothetical protein [Elusimicrobiota bacterium]
MGKPYRVYIESATLDGYDLEAESEEDALKRFGEDEGSLELEEAQRTMVFRTEMRP